MVYRGPRVVSRIVAAVIYFSVAALVGPFLRWVTWPSSVQGFFTPMQSFLYDLVILIWPAQVIWDAEISSTYSGLVENIFWAVGGNFFLFWILGAVAGALANRPRRLLIFYLFVCAWELSIILYLKEFSPAYYDLLAVAVAWLVYALPFWATAKIGRISNK